MTMFPNGCRFAIYLCSFIYIALQLCVSSASNATSSSDVQCLRTVKESIEDPLNNLGSTWKFDNEFEGFICQFTGVECWHQNENRVLNIRLIDLGLRGQFPRGLENCTTMTGLDLSSNHLSGPIPADINKSLQFLTTLDLSSNQFSGGIPSNLGDCKFLNSLKLDNNRLTGQIPIQLSKLNRLKTFSVSNNLLSGPVPNLSSVANPNYANNPGLCGALVSRSCSAPGKSSANGALIAGVAVGAAVLATCLVGLLLYYSRGAVLKKADDPEGNRWAMRMKRMKDTKVSLFESSASKMRLSDLMKATDSFNKSNLIEGGRTGVMYKGMLPNGYCLMIKRLQESQHSKDEFISEMNTLGSVKHQNLVPLLGFCVAKKERLLVYRYMANGTLHDRLHPAESNTDESMDWPVRLRIGLGAARGLAWLHHSCNPRILHRNISSKCILLDEDLEPRLSDFGLARLMNPVDTHLSTFVNGEFGDLGYVAPEYARTLVATPKGDVYSFGVVLLELITGQSPTHVTGGGDEFKGSLAEWMTHLSTISLSQTAIHESLLGKGADGELNQFLRVACSCVSPDPKERPTMFDVYQLLRAIGQRYHFKADDEILVTTDTGDADMPDELIVAQDKFAH